MRVAPDGSVGVRTGSPARAGPRDDVRADRGRRARRRAGRVEIRFGDSAEGPPGSAPSPAARSPWAARPCWSPRGRDAGARRWRAEGGSRRGALRVGPGLRLRRLRGGRRDRRATGAPRASCASRPWTTRARSSTRSSPKARCWGESCRGSVSASSRRPCTTRTASFATASFADYSLLTAAELPPIETRFVETPSPLNPLGAKGIGEGGAIGTPAAVANAVADALGAAATWTRRSPRRSCGGCSGRARVKPAPFVYAAPRTVAEALALARPARRGRSPAGRASCRCSISGSRGRRGSWT